jgi:preprotein translocase subunit SecF
VDREDMMVPAKEGLVGGEEETEEPPEWLNRM